MIKAEIGAVFIPVSDIEAARRWYMRLLKIEDGGQIAFGHLWVVPMSAGSGLVLDSKDFSPHSVAKPLFHFNSSSLEAARLHCTACGASEVSSIIDGAFFTFRDPDRNKIMVANVNDPVSGTS